MQESAVYWNTIAPKWDRLLANSGSFPNHGEAARRFHWFLKRKIRIGNRTKTYRLLDLGCGTGEASWPLWKRVASVTFFDRASGMLKIVRNKYEKGIFVRGEASKPPFLDEEFDVILSRGALISQIARDAVPSFLREAWRILRPHGFFLFDFVAHREKWPGSPELFPNVWTRNEMESLLRTHLPKAGIEAWDGTKIQAVARVLIKK